MDYEKLLDRGLAKVPEKEKASDRFEMPVLKVQSSGSRSLLANFKETAKVLRREPSHVMKFLLKELATSGEMKGSGLEVQTIDKTSGGLRFFGRVGGWRLETGYLYKGDAKVATDLLGHRPYFSFHGHAGVDLYGAVSLAAGRDGDAGVNRDSWDEISKTVNFSFGAFHQLQTGYDSTLTIRLETLVMPWQNWSAQKYQEVIDGDAGYYGIMIYPEITWMMRSTWYTSVQSVISPVDASAQITTTFGWHVFQGFTLLGFVVVNAGDEQSLFAYDRSGAWPLYPVGHPDEGINWADYEFNGVNITLGARYSY